MDGSDGGPVEMPYPDHVRSRFGCLNIDDSSGIEITEGYGECLAGYADDSTGMFDSRDCLHTDDVAALNRGDRIVGSDDASGVLSCDAPGVVGHIDGGWCLAEPDGPSGGVCGGDRPLIEEALDEDSPCIFGTIITHSSASVSATLSICTDARDVPMIHRSVYAQIAFGSTVVSDQPACVVTQDTPVVLTFGEPCVHDVRGDDAGHAPCLRVVGGGCHRCKVLTELNAEIGSVEPSDYPGDSIGTFDTPGYGHILNGENAQTVSDKSSDAVSDVSVYRCYVDIFDAQIIDYSSIREAEESVKILSTVSVCGNISDIAEADDAATVTVEDTAEIWRVIGYIADPGAVSYRCPTCGKNQLLRS